jgi:type I restriction enzyme M protein
LNRNCGAAAEALRNNMDAAEYKHVVLCLIFLKYISAFEAKHAEVDAQRKQGADPEDPDEYRHRLEMVAARFRRRSEDVDGPPQPTIGQLTIHAGFSGIRYPPPSFGAAPRK